MHRFYLKAGTISGERVLWDEKESRHIARVLRLSPGEKVIGFDGSGYEYDILLEETGKSGAVGKILEKRAADREVPVYLELVQGLAKADKMDWIVQKAQEVGVSAIRPIVTRYTVVKLEEKKLEPKRARWEQIAVEASKQCRRNTVAAVHPIVDYPALLAEDFPGVSLLCYENTGDEPSLKEILNREREKALTKGVRILIGPEGGWEETEVAAAREKGIHIVGLGPRILRTETAGLVAASAVLYEMGALE